MFMAPEVGSAGPSAVAIPSDLSMSPQGCSHGIGCSVWLVKENLLDDMKSGGQSCQQLGDDISSSVIACLSKPFLIS